ncbi:hypothetical protein RZS08_58395, partial [Arthrospira platensis SPKY1]|nr:hypothetical protein [Arthrospira platensis SPKY1]
MGNPEDYRQGIISIYRGQHISRNGLLHKLVEALYSRSGIELSRGTFRVAGDTIEVNLPYVEYNYRISMWGDQIESIDIIETNTGKTIERIDSAIIYPANLY